MSPQKLCLRNTAGLRDITTGVTQQSSVSQNTPALPAPHNPFFSCLSTFISPWAARHGRTAPQHPSPHHLLSPCPRSGQGPTEDSGGLHVQPVPSANLQLPEPGASDCQGKKQHQDGPATLPPPPTPTPDPYPGGARPAPAPMWAPSPAPHRHRGLRVGSGCAASGGARGPRSALPKHGKVRGE